MAASVKRRLGEKLLMPIVAAGTSAAVGYVAKRAPGFVEEKVWPRVGDARLQDRAHSLVSGGSELAEQLTERAKDVTGGGEDEGETTGDSAHAQDELARRSDELARRSEERARHRAERRKTTSK
jgi:hypothetical protein